MVVDYVVEIDDEDASTPPRYRDVLSQEGTTIGGLNTGTNYRFRVFITENEEEVATSRIASVEIPVVTAIPGYSIDSGNPYVIHLHAWKPEAGNGDTWRFSWIIGNTEIMVQNSQDFSYEFGTRGRKTVQLKVYDSLDVGSASNYDISDPFYVDITTDILPVIEYVLAEDGRYVELTCTNSLGYNIDFAAALWSLTGPDGSLIQLSGPAVIADISSFSRKLNVNLSLPRIPVSGQQATDTIVKTRVIESVLDTPGINIDWDRTRWYIYDNNQDVTVKQGAEITHAFSLNSEKLGYPVLVEMFLKGDTRPFAKYLTIDVEGDELVPMITTLIANQDNPAQLILSAETSTGSGIDWQQTKWTFIDSAEVAYGPVVNH